MIRTAVVLIATTTVLASGCRQAPLTEDALERRHELLLGAYLPEPLPAEAAGELAAATWHVAAASPEFQASLAALPASFEAADAGARARTIEALLESPRPDTLLHARRLRNVALLMVYGSPLGAQLAGLAADESVTAPTPIMPELPAARVAYDADTGTLRAREGVIDTVIVGSGPAGSLLAHELRRDGRMVVLVEQGAFVLPGALDGRRASALLDAGGIRPTCDGSVFFRNATAVGGGSTVNVDLAFAPTLPAVAARIERWRRAGSIAPDQWLPEEIASADAWVRAHVGTRQASASEINANNALLWDGALARGLTPSLYSLNTHAPGTSPRPASDKRSAVEAFVLPALRDPVNPLTLLARTRVERILFADDGRATGVEVVQLAPWSAPDGLSDLHGLGVATGARYRIPARRVVVAAGALGSPLVLLASACANPNIGRGLVGHPSMPLIGHFDRVIDSHLGTPATVYVEADRRSDGGHLFESMSAGPEYVAMMTQGPPTAVAQAVRSFRHLGGFGVLLVDEPDPANRIWRDETGQPRIDYHFSEADRRRFAAAVAEAAAILFAAGAQRVTLPSVEVPALESPADAEGLEARLHFVPSQTILTAAHLQATCKMGSDPASSVVSHEHRLWGSPNVYVVDGSVFPTSVGANPMQTIYATAKIFADHFTEIVDSE